MPPKGFSWRQERDWDVHNAEEWLVEGLPSHLSSETLNGRKASKKKFARTMELEPRDYISQMPAGFPPQIASLFDPLMKSLKEIKHLVGVQLEPFDYWGMDENDDDDGDCPIREVMLSRFTVTAMQGPGGCAGEKLNVVFLRNHKKWMSSGTEVFPCEQKK